MNKPIDKVPEMLAELWQRTVEVPFAFHEKLNLTF